MAHLNNIDNVAPADSLKAGADTLNTWRGRLDELHQTLGLGSLTAVEVTQLQALGTVTILNAQWGYLGDCTAAGGALLDDVNASAQRTTLGLVIGTDVQAYDADLSAIAALAKTDGNFIVGNGSTWIAESGATARTSLGLGSMAIQAHGSVNIDGGTIGGITLDGAIAGGDQTFTNVGNITFAAGSILASGNTNTDTLLLKANDTTCITLTTAATDQMDLAAVYSLTAINNLDIGAYTFTCAGLIDDTLTSGRVVFASSGGLLADDADMTFSTDTLTVKKLILNDATTATTDMLTLTPAGAVATTAIWKGIYIDGDALDPSGDNAAIEGIYVDLSGVAGATGLEMRGVYASVPTGLGYEALHIVGKIKLDNDESSLAAGETATGIDIIVLASAAGGGEYHAIDVATTGTSSASLTALGTHTGIDVIHQHAGAFISPTKAWTYDDSGSSYAEVTTEFGSAGSDVTIFDEDDDAIFIGADAVFDEIEVILATAASVDIKPTFWYSKAASFQPFFPADDTEGFTQDGIIRFVGSDLTDFAAQDVEGTSKFYIKIVRTKNNVTTDPIEDTIKTLAATECFWNSTGALQVVSIGAFQATGAIDFNDQNMTSVDIDSGTIGGVTLDGTVAGGDQAFTGVGDMTFTNGSILKSEASASDTLLLAANDTTCITLTTGATDKVEFASVNALIAINDIDIGAHNLRAATMTADGLTATRVVFAGTAGLLSDNSNFTFVTDTLTVTKLGAFEATGAINFGSQAMTNVDINSGTIDGTTIGAASAAALTCTTFTSTGIDDNADANALTISVDEVVSLGAAKLTVGATTPTATQWGYLGAMNQGVVIGSVPAFQAVPAGTQSNIAINTEVTVVFDTEIFDIGSNFASNTFTAPVTGKYFLGASLSLNAIDIDAAYYQLQLITSNRTYYSIMDPTQFAGDLSYWELYVDVIADMDATDTAYIALYQSGGAAQTDITTQTTFSGVLVG